MGSPMVVSLGQQYNVGEKPTDILYTYINRHAEPPNITMLLPSGNPFKCHEEVLYLRPMIPPKRFDIFFPLTGGCSEGLGAF